MLKKVLVGTAIVAVLMTTFLLSGVAFGSASGHTPSSVGDDAAEALVKGPDTDAVEEQVGNQTELDENVGDDAAEALVEGQDTDAVEEQVGNQTELDEQQPQYSGSIKVDEAKYEGVSEADEAAALQGSATISAANAEAAALAANPGASVIKTELDNGNGVLVYSVELSNGSEVKVDAGTGKVLYTESGELDSEDQFGGQEADED